MKRNQGKGGLLDSLKDCKNLKGGYELDGVSDGF